MTENIPLTYSINCSVPLYSIGYQYIAIIDNFLNAKTKKSFPKKLFSFPFFVTKFAVSLPTKSRLKRKQTTVFY